MSDEIDPKVLEFRLVILLKMVNLAHWALEQMYLQLPGLWKCERSFLYSIFLVSDRKGQLDTDDAPDDSFAR